MFLCLKYQNRFNNKKYLSYIDFNIIIPNMSTCFSIAVFYSKCLTPYSIVKLSILANLYAAVPRFWYHKMIT